MGMISARFIKAPPMIITGKGNRFFYIYNTGFPTRQNTNAKVFIE